MPKRWQGTRTQDYRIAPALIGRPGSLLRRSLGAQWTRQNPVSFTLQEHGPAPTTASRRLLIRGLAGGVHRRSCNRRDAGRCYGGDSKQPDLILMDLTLPDDGEEATRQIKTDPATKRIPIIALTANAMSNDGRR